VFLLFPARLLGIVPQYFYRCRRCHWHSANALHEFSYMFFFISLNLLYIAVTVTASLLTTAKTRGRGADKYEIAPHIARKT
jgi:hypothetical protein